MSRKITIPITDHNDGDTCSLYYSLRIKPASLSNWTQLENQFPEQEGSPAQWVLTINNLEDDTVYDYEITRHCCEGTISTAATGTFDTTL